MKRLLRTTLALAAAGGGLVLGGSSFAASERMTANGELLRADPSPTAVAPSAPLYSNLGTDAGAFLANGGVSTSGSTRYTSMVCNRVTLSQPGPQQITAFSVVLHNDNGTSFAPSQTSILFYDDSGANGGPGIRLLNKAGIYYGGGNYSVTLPASSAYQLNAAPFGYTAAYVPAQTPSQISRVWACVQFAGTSTQTTQLASLGLQKYTNAPTVGSTEDLAFVSTVGVATPVDNPAGTLVTGAGAANVFGWELTTLGSNTLLDSYQVKNASGTVGTASFSLNPSTGVEKNFSGYAATIDVPPLSAGKWNVTGMVLYPSCTVANYTSVQATIQLWDTFNGSAAPDVFGNTTPIASTTLDLGPFNCTSATSVYQFPVRLPTPILIGRSGQLGITVKYAADSGSGFVDGAFMEVIQNAPTASPLIAVGANASTGGTGWYKSASNRADLNFNGATDYVTGTRTHTALRVYADMVAPTRVVTISTNGPGTGTVSPGTGSVFEGSTVTYKLTPAAGNHVLTVTGTCPGTLAGSTFTAGPITANCTINAVFAPGVLSNGLYRSPAMNHALLNNTNGSTLNLVTGAWDDSGPTGGNWDLNAWGSSGALRFWPVSTYSNKLVLNGTSAAVMQPGDVVNSSAAFSGTGTTVTPDAAWLAGTDAYVGFQFACNGRLANPVSGGPCYGYARLTTTGPSGFPATLVDYVYDGDGNPVTVGTVVRAVTASVNGTDGFIDPLGNRNVADGGTVTYTLYPNAGYHVGTIGGTCPAGTLTGNSYTTGPVTADCTVIANFASDATPPTVTKAFSPASVAVGSNSTATITLTNPNATAITLTADLVDTLPAGLIASAASTTCTGGTASFTSGTLKLASGATIPANGNCRLTGTVKSLTAGSYVNTIPVGALQTSAGSNTVDASATLTVTAGTFPAPYCTRGYGSGVEPITRVTIDGIDNSSPAATAGATANENFTAIIGQLKPGASYPITVQGNTDGNFTSSVAVYIDWNQNGTFDANEGYLIGGLTNSTGADGKSVSTMIPVPVDALLGPTRMRVAKQYTSGTVGLSAVLACGTTGFGQAEDYTVNVDVAAPVPPSLAKSFAPAYGAAGATSTLTLSLGNTNGAPIALTAALTDTFPTGLVVAATPNATTTCGGAVTATAGASSISLANGATIPDGGCTVKVDVTAATAGIYVNTIAAGALQTTKGNAGSATATYQATAAGVATYSTGFEAPDYTVGGVNGQQGWYASVAADWNVATANPGAGAQHARGTWASAGSGTSFILSPTQLNGTTPYSVAKAKLAITVANTGATWDFAPQDPGAGSVITRVRFLKDTGNKIQVLDPNGGGTGVAGYVDTGATWTGGGAYFDLKVIAKRADNTYTVCVNGTQIWNGPGFAGSIGNIAIIGNKGTGTQGNILDVDNVVVDNTTDGNCSEAPPVTHVVTPSVGAGNGTITPATPQTVNHGATTSFTLAPAGGFRIDTVEGTCGGSLAGSVYTTNPVNADCTVIAKFAVDVAAAIAVTPANLSASQAVGASTTQTLTIANTGGGTLTWNIGEENARALPAMPASPHVAQPAREEVGAPVTAAAVVAGKQSGKAWMAPLASLYDNGPLVTNPGAGAGGKDASALQTSVGNTSYGSNVSASNSFRAADDFTVPAGGWTVDKVTLFTYQTGSTTTSTITGANLRIWNGVPGAAGSTVVFGDTTTNRMASTAFSNIYRVLDTGLTDSNRPIMAVVVTVGTTLPAGTYWLDWQLSGSLASGPWAPPVTIVGATGKPGANAMQYDGTTWAAVTDGGSLAAQDFPFLIEGTAGGGAPACSNPSDIPWLSLSTTSGSNAGGTNTPVTVTFNATGVAAGSYSGRLCVNSNDAANPLVVVPVSFTVTPPSGGQNGIINSGPINHQIAATTLGTSLNIVSSATDDTGPTSGNWDFNFWSSSNKLTLWKINSTNGGQYAVDGTGKAKLFQPGEVIGPSTTFSTGTGASVAMADAWLAGTTSGYLGVKFNCNGRLTNPVAAPGVCYGYVRIQTTGPNGFPATILDTSFDGDGNALTIPGGGGGAPTVSKAFSPSTVTTGANSTATITLSNPNATAATLTAALVDTLPSGLVASAATTTCGGSVSFTAGSVTLASGATIPASGSCTISATVSAAAVGSYVNTIAAGALQTNAGSNAAAASATLTVSNALPFPQPYCDVTFPSSVEPITRVKFRNIDNTSSATVGGSPALENFLSVAGGNVSRGGLYAMAVEGNTDGNFTTKVKAYIDWNQNGVFDADEGYVIGDLVNSTGTDGKQVVANIQVPATATLGQTRMRVIKRFNTAPDACNAGGYGQAEDYTLTVDGNALPIPDASVTPATQTFTAEQGASATGTMTISNGTDSLLTFDIRRALAERNAQDAAAREAASRLAAERAERAVNDAAKSGVTMGLERSVFAAGKPVAGRPFQLLATQISQMANNTPEAANGVACGSQANGTTSDNSWWRRFYFSEHSVGASVKINSVTVASETGPSIPVTVKVYTIPHSVTVDTIPLGQLTLIGTGTGTVGGDLTTSTIAIGAGAVVDDTSAMDLVVEYHIDGSSTGAFYPGGNSSAQTHPTFISSAGCSIASPTNAASINFPDFHIIMVVDVEDAGPPGVGCDAPSNVAWLSTNPSSGTINGIGSKDVTVKADATGLAVGTHTAQLCVNTNDPAHPRFEIPVTFNVTPQAPADKIFKDGFDGQPTGVPGVYTSRATFLANAPTTFYEENFANVPLDLVEEPLPFSGAGVSYTVFSSDPYDPGTGSGGLYNPPGAISTNSASSKIVITITSGTVKAIGGNFWATDISFSPTGTTTTLTLSDGTVETYTSTGPSDFRGFVTTTPITKLEIDTPNQGTTPIWPALDNLIVAGSN
jgi:hypothetical protein